MTTASFGPVSIRPPSFGPLITKLDADHQCIDMRLGHEAELGLPLMVGLLPAPHIGTAAALTSSRFAPWQSLGDSMAGLFTVDVSWPESPDGRWAVFLLHAQPPGHELLIDHPHTAYRGDMHYATGTSQSAEFKPPQDTDNNESGHMFRRLHQAIAHRQTLSDGVTSSHAIVASQHTALACRTQDALRHQLAAPGTRWPEHAILQPPHEWLAPLRQSAPRATRFVLGSCQFPGGILERTPRFSGATPSPCDASLSRISLLRQSTLAPDFILLIGDQVYVDSTAELSDPINHKDRYTRPYLEWLTRPMVQQALCGIALYTMVDDAELCDDWAPVSPDASRTPAGSHTGEQPALHFAEVKHHGLNSYWAYQGHRPDKSNVLYRIVGPASQPDLVFMADTRSEREQRHAGNIEHARIMSKAQWQALQTWLANAQGKGPRFLACPSLVLPRRWASQGNTPASALVSDAWDGHPASLHDLLAGICDGGLNNLVLLSGDEHLASICEIKLKNLDTGIETDCHSVHTPALYAPYPFVNSLPSMFNDQAFSFASSHSGQRYTCETRTWFPSLDNGFVLFDSPLGDTGHTRIKVTLSFPDNTPTPSTVPPWLRASDSLDVQIERHPPGKLA